MTDDLQSLRDKRDDARALADLAPALLAELKGWVENEASMVDDQIKWGAMNGFYSPEQCAQILRTRALIARVEGRS